MKKKVFVLGAGFNQFLKRGFFSSGNKNLPPPMSKNFFKYSLERQNNEKKPYIIHGITDQVLDYIQKNFNRSKDDLLKEDFDLELLFTFIESQINDAKATNNKDFLNYLYLIRLNLIISIGETFFELDWKIPADGRDLLIKFGEIIYNTKSDVITFNYDCLVEWGIEKASGHNLDSRKEGMPYFNWDRYSSYAIEFSRIRMTGGFGYWDATRGRNKAKKFYKKFYNPSPDINFLKLHGSYNWYKYSHLKRNKILDPFSDWSLDELSQNSKLYISSKKVPENLKNELICFNGDWQFGILPTWDSYGGCPRQRNVLEPFIIPPILFKENDLRKDIFQKLWNLAKESLLKCDELIFIGYSFPDTDFYSKKLFIEVFSERKNIAVTIVNPDNAVKDKFIKLVNFKDSVQHYLDSGEFIRNFN